jgi:hypothetical protein
VSAPPKNSYWASPILVVQVWILTRGLVASVAVGVMLSDHLDFKTIVGRWDVAQFLKIAQHGYAPDNDVAYFPGLPMLLRGLSWTGLPMEVIGVLGALIASALAAWALYRMLGAPATCLWLIAPTAVFTMVPYTEAFFCAAAFWAWERARANCWWAAGLLAGLACLFRVSGLFLWGGLGLLAITQVWQWWRSGKRRLSSDPKDRVSVPRSAAQPASGSAKTFVGILKALGSRIVWLIIPLLVLGGYEIYLHAITGSWNAWFDAQSTGWSRSLTAPLVSLQHTVDAGKLAAWPGRPDVAWVFRAEIVSMAVGVLTALIALVRRRLAEFGYVGIQAFAFATSYWFMSVNRAVLLWFPTFGFAADAIAWEPSRKPVRIAWRVLCGLCVLASFAAMLVWSWLFFTSRWAS